ncbi:hypothetical protein FJQ87_18530 (plasmid) [Shewanella sp. SNU WT4]|uniref:hypothetical protein n=1 Tax=Shewanella sp. SNU WT4 TaxID=2590015 RepID=UPI00112EC578|nr:hypothetical protein [Shewanella sp. SNU WT4]QDF68702.1 hypothetical protein FJQ87_18530 [Shewanella sp. SNU WT4]
MDVFKISSLSSAPIPIKTKEAFETLTKKQKPWMQLRSTAKSLGWHYYAECPHCVNTIEIIGFTPTHTATPHGRHYMKHITGVGYLDHESYEACPYRARSEKNLSKDDKYSANHHLPSKALNTLIEQFDRVVYLLQKELEIKFSYPRLKQMLLDFKASQGWLYKGASEYNIPWIFAYFTLAKSLYNQQIVNNELQSALLKLEPKLQFESTTSPNKADRLLITEGLFLKLTFSFFDHEREVREHHLFESINFKVSSGARDIYSKKIEFDPLHFANLINLDENKAQRRLALVDMAKEIFAR